MPSPRIAFVRMIQSNGAVRDIIISDISFLLLTVSAPPETRGGDKDVSGTSKIGYVHHVPP